MNKNSIWWFAPEYFSRWRLFPRAFISMYIYLLWKVVTWFMALEAPTMEQAGLVSVIVGAGAAWFGLYVNSSSTKFEQVEVKTTSTGSEAKLSDTRETKKKTLKKIDNSKYENDY
jgi:hypothetical protein